MTESAIRDRGITFTLRSAVLFLPQLFEDERDKALHLVWTQRPYTFSDN
jgi:hypothetical protein